MSKYNLDMNIPDMCQECGFLIEEDDLVHCVRENGCEGLKNWIADHDKQIRDEFIERLQKDTNIPLRALATELMKNQKNYSEDTCHYFSKGIQAFVIHIEKFIEDTLKGEQNDNN